MPEEFGAILGLSFHSSPALPNLDADLSRDFRDYLGLTNGVEGILVGRNVDLCRLIAHFTSPSYPRTVIDFRYRKRALVLCLLNRYLFVSSSAIMGHGCLLKVVKQMRNDCSPVPLILAETLHCLDAVSRDPEVSFSGSPLLLQVWLQEHMRLIERPLDPMCYQAKNFAARRRIIKGEQSLGYWRDFMSSAFAIRWIISWWRIPAMTAPRSSISYYQLPGLSHSSFIFPSCLLRQFGRRQRIPSRDTISPGVQVMTDAHLRNWYQYWNARQTLPVLGVPETTYISREYRVWMLSPSAEEREKARGDERRMRLDIIEMGRGSNTNQLGLKKRTLETTNACKSGKMVWKRKQDRDDADDEAVKKVVPAKDTN
ncbi:hypothetical protein RND81_02G242000 [Saponaria officinalis]|uniref:Aminotransferase-like plant mobile domain-containing protein n=1 Tax=Saponaria officinalis TaxID=3572 RepID=A0AAW1MXY2_SAPOF